MGGSPPRKTRDVVKLPESLNFTTEENEVWHEARPAPISDRRVVDES